MSSHTRRSRNAFCDDSSPGATACTNARVGAVYGFIKACDQWAAAHHASPSALDTCGRSEVRLNDGSPAWFVRGPCHINCGNSDVLIVSGRRGLLYVISGKSVGLDGLMVIADGLRPPSDAPTLRRSDAPKI